MPARHWLRQARSCKLKRQSEISKRDPHVSWSHADLFLISQENALRSFSVPAPAVVMFGMLTDLIENDRQRIT